MEYYLVLGGLLWIYMTAWFVVSLIKKRNDVADVAWGIGFVLIAWTAFFLGDEMSARALLANILVTVWGLRLAWHIHLRNRNKTEDYRYATWRKEWGGWFYPRSYAQVYLLQGALLYAISLSVLFINSNGQAALGLLDYVGVCVWMFGFYFESTGDAQLKRFLKDPQNKGKLMRSGLWQYTRHPNYFGEVTQWWGLWIMTLSIGFSWAFISPLTITVLILFVSGIPMLEKKMRENPEFAEYERQTNKFIPWFKKV